MTRDNPSSASRRIRLPCLFAVVLTFSFLAIACAQQMSAERIAALNADISAVESEIKAAEAENARYEGGLIKALCSARLAILRQTRAMLAQRSKAWTFGVALKYTVDGRSFSLPPRAKDDLTGVERELAELETKIQNQEREAGRYSGGLIHAMSLSTLATMRQTQAMLEQRRLALKYELPQYVAFAAQKEPTAPTSSVAPLSAPKADGERDFEIIDVDTRVTESNDVWWKYAWRLTLKNKSDKAQMLRATIEFQDKDGFIVDSDDSGVLVVPAMSQEVFTGYDLVNAEVAGKVARTAAKVRRVSY